MKKHSYDDIRRVFHRKGYTFFTKGRYNLNLIGVRSENSQSDQFDDYYHIIYRGADNRFKHHIFACTTDPGKHWLLNPMNVRGTIIMVPGQYRGVYKWGIHGRSWGGYPALEQVVPMCYVRDNNKDLALNFNLYRDPCLRCENEIWENAKTNTHRASTVKTALKVNRYSAGCQVIQEIKDFNTLGSLVKLALNEGWGNRFSYTLLEEREL